MKKTVIRILSAVMAVVVLLICSSCAEISAGELSAGYTRNVTEETPGAVDFSAAVADFSFELFRHTLTDDNRNDLISPLSAILCLALVANGADGQTLAQMEAVLGMDVDTLNQSLYAYTASLPDLEGSRMKLANSVWFRNDGLIEVEEDFLQRNADWYGAQVYKAPFDNTTVKDINAWVDENTDGMIDSILDRVSPTSVMYLINALVFDAKWQTEYEKSDIRDRTFYNADGSKTTADMMYSEEGVYFEGDTFTGFSKNYKGSAYSFVGLLPKEGNDVYSLVASLDGDSWLEAWSARQYTTVEVGIPEFKYEAGMELNDPLIAMGMTDMFDAFAADFSRLGKSNAGNIYCSTVQQKTVIDVSRHGTKAAAVTWATLECGSAEPLETKYVILDRPFVYAIVDNATGLPIFLGAVSSLD